MVEEGGFAQTLCLGTGYEVPGINVGPLGALTLHFACLTPLCQCTRDHA